jgi:hypothetical protein
VLDKDKRTFVVDVGVGSVQQRFSTGDAPTAFDAQIIFSIPLQAFTCVRVCAGARMFVGLL